MVFNSLFRSRRRRMLLAEPLPESWRGWLTANVRLYSHLPAALQRKLENDTRIIVAERTWVGCGGLVLTEEMKVTVAGQASLLLLGEEGYYFDRVPSILLYPQAYVRPHKAGDQHSVDEEAALLGESWQRGSIVLSWPAVLAGGKQENDGQNLVLHEFAHHLDGLDGEMGGTPPLATRAAEGHWHDVFDREYDRLIAEVSAGRETLLDPYGTTNMSELFAVATECFFERASQMRERHAELYACFCDFYKIDPATWDQQVPHRPAREPAAPEESEEDAADGPDSTADLPPLATADQYFTRASEHFDLGRFDLAEADFDQVVRLDPDDQEALLHRAECRFWLGHLEVALADADRAVRLAPADIDAIRLRGMCRVSLDSFQEGLADLLRATDASPSDVDAWYYRGVAHAELGQAKAAIAAFDRVLELDPDDADARAERKACLGGGRDGETERRRE
jgi:Mlc titration factor MtfA (ptsG expression regulator)/Flp pilus assembly protein TadD